MAIDGVNGSPRVEPLIRPTTLDREREQEGQRREQEAAPGRERSGPRQQDPAAPAREGDAVHLTDAAIEQSIGTVDDAKRIANRVIYQIQRNPGRAVQAQASNLNQDRTLDLIG
jgi:hypothetical protein